MVRLELVPHGVHLVLLLLRAVRVDQQTMPRHVSGALVLPLRGRVEATSEPSCSTPVRQQGGPLEFHPSSLNPLFPFLSLLPTVVFALIFPILSRVSGGAPKGLWGVFGCLGRNGVSPGGSLPEGLSQGSLRPEGGARRVPYTRKSGRPEDWKNATPGNEFQKPRIVDR